MTWLDLVKDFQHHRNTSKTCVAECYENHFTRPLLGFGVWLALPFLLSFLWSSFLSCRLCISKPKCVRNNLQKRTQQTPTTKQAILRQKTKFFTYPRESSCWQCILSIFLQFSLQVILVILIHYHLPLIKKSIWFSTHMCHGPYTWVAMWPQEKIMSVILLATVSVVIITSCISVFLYTINAYVTLCKEISVCLKSRP